jgi:hypothetical protein
MAYDADLDSTHNPATSTVAPASWGDLINGNFADMGAWESYTPTWASTGTDPTLGNGTIAGSYQQRDKFLVFRVRLVMGSTTTYGTGTWSLTAPTSFTAVSRVDGFGRCTDAGVGNWSFAVRGVTSTTVSMLEHSARANVTNTAPFTWASTDDLSFTAFAELA